MSLKILYLTSDFPTHPDMGRNLYLWHPLQALRKINVESVVLNAQTWKPGFKKPIKTSHFPIIIEQFYYFSIPRYYMRAISNYAYLKTILPKIKKLHQLHQFDIIHAHGEINGLAAVAASKQLHIPAIITIHGIETCPRLWKGYAGEMFHVMLNEINKIIYVGEPLQKYFSKIVNDEQRCQIVHNGFRLPSTPTNRNFNNNQLIRIISVSNLNEGKGVDLTLHALAQLKKRGIENWIYTIIGQGHQKRYLENITSQFDLTNQVKFLRDCTHKQVYANLEKSDIFCLPSYREAFGIAYIEAMAHGLLTIGVRGEGPQAFIEHGKTGLLVEPRNINNLMETLQLAITQVGNMQEIVNAGKEHVLTHFTWEKHAKKLLSIYQDSLHE